MSGRPKAHHRGTHQADSARIRDAAYRDPTTRCRRCGLTLAEKRLEKPNDGWDAGHPEIGEVGLAAEHISCNRSAGASHGNRMRQGLNTTQDW